MLHLIDSSLVRSLAWRLGRRLYCWARRDVPNDPVTNGEYWLIDRILSKSQDEPGVLIDIGANRGNWSAEARATLARLGCSAKIYAFEPARTTYVFLSERFKTDTAVKPEWIALSERTGETELFVVGQLAGTNSLSWAQGATVEIVRTQRLDDYLDAAQIATVLLVKSDTEGHDMAVLRGAEQRLRSGSIDVWQFEYNHRWLANHSSLKDVFDFIKGKPYRLGKLYGNGIEIYESWHPELDRFFECNYLLVRTGSPIESLCTIMRFDVSNVLVPER